MNCPKCGMPIEEGALFCGECGTYVSLQKHYCVKCGTEVVGDEKLCDRCKNNEISSTKTKNKKLIVIVAAALAIITLVAIIASSGKKEEKPSKPSGHSNPVGYTEEPEGMIEMINVVEMTSDEAIERLHGLGFTNIITNMDSETEQRDWFVVKQSVKEGRKLLPDARIELICAYKCGLDLSITSETNLLFSKYDMIISLDGDEIGTVSNGETFSRSVEVFSGEHELCICKLGEYEPNCKREFTVSDDTYYTCDVAHGESSIEIKNEEITIISAIEMLDVTERILSEAMVKLQEEGFSNVREEPSSSIWDKDNWIVVTQSVAAGKMCKSNEFIQLDCIKLDEYFSNAYVGKTINEIQAHAKARGFSLWFVDDSWNDINAKVASMDDDEKENWIATSARQYTEKDKTARVSLTYIGEEAAETETPKETSTPKPNANKFSNRQVEKLLDEILSESFGDYSVNIKDSIVNIVFYVDGLTNLVFNATVYEDPSAIEEWNSFVNSIQSIDSYLSGFVKNDLEREDLIVAVYCCEDPESDTTYLIVMDGVVYYDPINGINLLHL